MAVLTLAVKTRLYERDIRCPICKRKRVRLFPLIFRKPSGVNGSYSSADAIAACRGCIAAVKAREVGIAGNAEDGLHITDARKRLFS